MKTKLFYLTTILLVAQLGFGQLNINKLKNKAKNQVNKEKKEEKEEEKKETTNSSTSTNNNNSTTSTNTSNEGNYLVESANFYDKMESYIDRHLPNVGNREWSHDFMNYLDMLDLPRLEARMEKDFEQFGENLMIYPKKLPTSGMGTLTQSNLDSYRFEGIRVADANAEPPSGENAKKMLDFYKEYVMFKHGLSDGKTNISRMITASIQEAEGAHPRNKFNLAKKAKRQATLAHTLMPDDMRIADLKDEADKTYNTIIDGFGNMISGEFHRNHLQEIVVFNSKPSFGSETDAQLVETIIPGEPAYVTGYFAMTNKTAGGIPSMLFINPEDKYAKDDYPWGHGVEVIAPMFNGENVKEEFREKAFFTFNLFPDVASVDYESHVQYFPHLNILKWLMYLPSEVVDIPVRFGRSEEVAIGRIKIDLSGDNKQKLKTYFEELKQKHLETVVFPDLAGCDDAKSKIRNYSDLSKYGEVIRISLTKAGDIMKPWPKDDEIDFNTANGYAAVKKSNGKIEVMPLDFRKRPNESTWQWWSVGSFPGLYPMNENGVEIIGVKKLEHGYEILPSNVSTCGYWYTPG